MSHRRGRVETKFTTKTKQTRRLKPKQKLKPRVKPLTAPEWSDGMIQYVIIQNAQTKTRPSPRSHVRRRCRVPPSCTCICVHRGVCKLLLWVGVGWRSCVYSVVRVCVCVHAFFSGVCRGLVCLVWSGLVWSVLVWSYLVWVGLIRSGLIGSHLVLSAGLVWSGLVWSGLV